MNREEQLKLGNRDYVAVHFLTTLKDLCFFLAITGFIIWRLIVG